MKRKFTFLLMVLLALTGFKSWGQESQTITIGTGTATLDDMPFNSFYNYSYAQMLYLGSEIGESGTITSISFYAEDGVDAYLKLDIYMKCVDRDSYSNTSDWESVSAENLVYHNESYLANSTGWITFNLVEPFQYDKSKNLMIAFDNNTGSYFKSKQFRYTNTSGNTCIYRSDDGTNIDPLNPIAGNVAVWRPNIQITIEPAVSCPAPTGLAASNVTTTGATISWTGNGAESYDLAYGVASTFDLSNPATYMLRDGLATTSVQLSGLTAETEYKCAVKAHCSAEEESDWSSVVAFTPSAKTTLTVNDGTEPNEKVPFWGYNADYHNTQSQFIIPANQIENLAGGTITDLTFYVSSPENKEFTYNAWKVYVKEVDETSVGYTYIDFGSMTEVYSGGLNIVDNKLVVHFNTPYVYNSSKNLMIGFCQTNHYTWAYTYWLGKSEGSEMRSRGGYEGNHASFTFLPKTTFTYIPGGERYTVTVNQPEEGGTISADPMANVAPETAVTLSATPSFGYEFGQWTVVDEGGNPVTLNGEATAATNGFSMPESNVTVSATFNTLEMYAITFDESITWTEMSANHESAPAGTTIELFYTPDEAYIFNYWTVNDAQIEGGTFEMPAEAVEVSMNYTVRSRYSVNIGDLENGTITANPSENILGGTEVTLTIEPATGYTLNELTVTEATSGNEVEVTDNTFEMPEDDVNVTATFSAVYYVTVDPQLVGGTITYTDLTSATAFAAGTTVYLTPEAYTDYVFVDNSIVATRTDNSETVAVSYNPNMGAYYIEMPASNVTVTATFNAIPYYEVTKVVDPMYSGNFDVSKTSHIEENEQIFISNIYPETGYEFGSVVVTRDDTGAEVTTTPYYGSYYFNMPNSDVTVTVTFNALPRYSVSVGEVVNGTITVDEPFENILAGTTVYFSATPATDYVLESLSVKCDNEDQTDVEYYDWYGAYRFYMPSSNVTISATFRQLQTYTINYYVNGELDRTMQCREDGLVNNDGPQNVAVPAGMTFEGWGVAEIGTYVTEKPAVLGNAESPTQNCDLYAVLSYTESVPAGSKDDKWVKVTDANDLQAGDEIVFVYNNLIMCNREGATYQGYPTTNVTVTDNEITSLPSNTAQFTLVDNNGYWKLQYDELGATRFLATSSSSYDLASDDLYQSWATWGYDVLVDWTAVTNNNSVIFRNDNINNYIGYYSYYAQISMMGLSYACQAYKKDNPTITTSYYMTSVLANGEVTASTTAKNIVITTGTVTVNDNIVLTMNGNGLFRNKNAANFVFGYGAQLITDNAGVLATMKKHINGIEWYTISSPLAASVNVTDVTNLIPNSVTDTNYDLYRFDEKNGVWVNSRLENGANPDFTTIDKGVGYIYSNTTAADVAFAGEINVADVECNLTNGAAHGFNLIGNPFSQNIKLTDVTGVTLADGFYVLNNDETWGTKLTESEIKPLQGFLVQATTAGDVTISKPTAAPSKGERSEQNTNIEMIVSNSIYRDNAFAMFGEGIGLNKVNHRNAQAPMLYVPQDGAKFAIAFMDENTTVFPLNFKAMTTGKYSVSLKATDDISTLVLVDNMTGAETNMLLEDSYTFIGSPRDNENRFTVKLKISNSQDEDEHFVYQNGSELVINGEGTLQIFDVLGRVVISEEVHGQTVNVGGLTTGAYIVRLTGESVKTQKIVVR